jgi:Zn-dependent protease with chaperone function
MIIALALLLGSLLVATHGHRPLLRMLRSNSDPRVSIVAWLFALGSVFATSVVGVLLLGLPGHGGVVALLASLNSCWATLQHGALPGWEEASAVLGAGALTAIVGRLVWVGLRQTRIRRERRERYQFLVTVAGVNQIDDSNNVVWLDHSYPLAFSVAGRPGLVAVSLGARDLLRAPALAATLEHEQAHLRGRHHLLLDIVDAAAAAIPVAPLFRAAPRAMRELVELAADVAATRCCSSTDLAEALRVLSVAPPAAEGIAMANSAVARRLARLQSGPACRGSAARALACTAVGLVAAVMPAVLGFILLSTVACPGG